MLSEGVQLDQLVGGARSRLWRLAVQRVRNQITVKQQALQLPCEADVVWQSVGESIVAQELKVTRREGYVRAAGEQAAAGLLQFLVPCTFTFTFTRLLEFNSAPAKLALLSQSCPWRRGRLCNQLPGLV